MASEILTQEHLKKLLNYNEKTGNFIWKTNKFHKCKIGQIAGSKESMGCKKYIRIHFNGKRYLAHRLVFLYINGSFPPDQVDHINGDGLDNRLINLRLASSRDNQRNTRKHINNTSGVCGVHWSKTLKKWCSSIRLNGNGRKKNLGYFTSFNDAVITRKMAEHELGYHPNHGDERPL